MALTLDQFGNLQFGNPTGGYPGLQTQGASDLFTQSVANSGGIGGIGETGGGNQWNNAMGKFGNAIGTLGMAQGVMNSFGESPSAATNQPSPQQYNVSYTPNSGVWGPNGYDATPRNNTMSATQRTNFGMPQGYNYQLPNRKAPPGYKNVNGRMMSEAYAAYGGRLPNHETPEYGFGGDFLKGAASGALAGSSFGPWGAAIGGVGMGLYSAFKGRKEDKLMAEQNKAAQQQMNFQNQPYTPDPNMQFQFAGAEYGQNAPTGLGANPYQFNPYGQTGWGMENPQQNPTGMNAYSMAQGGFLRTPDKEFEKGEVVKGPEVQGNLTKIAGDMQRVNGKPHSQGGTPVKGGEGGFVYSNKTNASLETEAMARKLLM